MNLRDHLPLIEAPESVWAGIEKVLDHNAPAPRRTFPVWRFALAVCILAAAALFWNTRPRWIETTAHTATTIRIGDIGTVEVSPNTRLRVLEDRPERHRLQLARGQIHATITAPPRLFFVETKSGTAIDLGCEYGLHMDEEGSGLLRVTRGWVSFQWKGVESLVPAGASCAIKPDGGPGIPYFDDAPAEFRQALDAGQLDRVIALSRTRDTLSLWHLMFRVTQADRTRIYDRIAALVPIPATISREQALQRDRDTLDRLKDELAWNW